MPLNGSVRKWADFLNIFEPNQTMCGGAALCAAAAIAPAADWEHEKQVSQEAAAAAAADRAAPSPP